MCERRVLSIRMGRRLHIVGASHHQGETKTITPSYIIILHYNTLHYTLIYHPHYITIHYIAPSYIILLLKDQTLPFLETSLHNGT